MITNKTVCALKERYPNIHPLIFQRSVDHAKNDGHLFDILDSFPKAYPITWSESEHRWVHTDDMFLVESFEN